MPITSKRIKIIFMLLNTTLLLACLLTASRTNKSEVAAGLPDPDAAFVTGAAAGYNVFIWNCYQDKRIVVFNSSGEMFSSPYQREEVACGGKTQIETTLTNAPSKREVDPKSFWTRP